MKDSNGLGDFLLTTGFLLLSRKGFGATASVSIQWGLGDRDTELARHDLHLHGFRFYAPDSASIYFSNPFLVSRETAFRTVSGGF